MIDIEKIINIDDKKHVSSFRYFINLFYAGTENERHTIRGHIERL